MASVVQPAPRDGDVPDEQRSAPLDDLADLSDSAWGCLEQLARALRVDEADLEATLSAIANSATTTVAAAEAAGINLWEKGRFLPQAVCGEAPPILDGLQQRTGSGPCIDASRDQVTIAISEMDSDDRWPQFARRAVDLGVMSMLCLPLWIDDRTLGSLSLYAPRPMAFDDGARRLAALFATHAALAVGDAQRTRRLRRAMTNRDVIGQAKGILMERHRMTADQAYELLFQASSRTNRKVIELAHEVAMTGQLSTS